MKTVCMVSTLIILAFIVTGCGSAEIQYPDTYVFGQDSQYRYINKNMQVPGCIAEAPNGYYFLSGPSNNFLYFYDKATRRAIPVCDKPDCLHANEPDSAKIAKCNAFLSPMLKFLVYYENALYYVITDMDLNPGTQVPSNFDALYQISVDGTQRREVLKVYGIIDYLEIHRGYVYYSVQDNGTISGQESTTKTKYQLYRFPLGKQGSKPEIIEEGEGIYADILNMICYGNDVYYFVGYFKDASLEKYIFSIKKYNIQTKETTKFLDLNSSKFVRFTIFNGQLVYSCSDGTFACDFDGANGKKIDDRYFFCSANEKYLFLDNARIAKDDPNGHMLTVIDKNWETVKVISLTDFKSPTDTILGCSDEYCFIPKYDNSNEFGTINDLYGIPVNKTIDDMEPVLLCEWVPKVPYNGISGN